MTILFCIPNSQKWRATITALINTLTFGRSWDRQTGTIKDAQEIGREIFNSMSFCDDIGAGLQAIASAMQGCCSSTYSGSTCIAPGIITGPGGGGVTDVPPTENVGDWETETPPEGFETFSAYQVYKCNVASWILDFFARDVSNAALINWAAGLTLPSIISLLVATLITPIPGDEVVVLAGAIFYLVTQGIIDPVLAMIDEVLTDEHDALLCALYEASTVEEARENVKTVLSDAFGASYSTVYAYSGNLLVGSWLRNDNLNKLFDHDTNINYPTSDCSSCQAATWFEIGGDELVSGSLLENTTGWVAILDENPNFPGNYYIYASNVSGACRTLRITGVTAGYNFANALGGGNNTIWVDCSSVSQGLSTSPLNVTIELGNSQTMISQWNGAPGGNPQATIEVLS